MGAKYAPSVANLFLAEWEEDALYNKKPQQLFLFKSCINDIIVIWAGDRDSLMDFCFDLNTNNKNIKHKCTLSGYSMLGEQRENCGRD